MKRELVAGGAGYWLRRLEVVVLEDPHQLPHPPDPDREAVEPAVAADGAARRR